MILSWNPSGKRVSIFSQQGGGQSLRSPIWWILDAQKLRFKEIVKVLKWKFWRDPGLFMIKWRRFKSLNCCITCYFGTFRIKNLINFERGNIRYAAFNCLAGYACLIFVSTHHGTRAMNHGLRAMIHGPRAMMGETKNQACQKSIAPPNNWVFSDSSEFQQMGERKDCPPLGAGIWEEKLKNDVNFWVIFP